MRYNDIKVRLPKSTRLCHKGLGVVIGSGVTLGENVHIYPHVMIGRMSEKKRGYPKIGNNVTIYTGAVVVGNINIGDNCIIGALSFVCRDLSPNTIIKGG